MTKQTYETRDCGYNFDGDCTNEDCGCYGLECPFKTFCECPVHNENVGKK